MNDNANTGQNEREDRLLQASQRWLEQLKDCKQAATESGLPLKSMYTPLDCPDSGYLAKLGFPGSYPFTRGVYPSMYRGRLWTIRQYAGLGTAEQTNERFRFLLERGQTGLSVALDLPTQMGYDSDDPQAVPEVGGVGVAIDTVDDMEMVFAGIPLEQISTHFTVNATAAVIFSMYLVAAEKRGIPLARLSGTLQNDILKEYISRNAYIFPPRPALRLIADIILYAYEQTPRFNPISITGYHVREAGASAVQEIAYTLCAAVTYVEMMRRRGIDVDAFAPRLSFHFSSQRDFFEEICKIRSARRLWAKIMKERFGAKDPRSMLMRYFNGGSGACLAHAEPMNNIIRGTLQCLAGVLAGAQACHVPSYDEAYKIPSEDAALLSMRTQQIIAYESNAPTVIDPLGGSYFVESLTDRLENEVTKLMEQVEARGGLVAGIENGEIRKAIMERAYELEKQLERGERMIVGVNAFVGDQAQSSVPAVPPRDPELARRQIARLKKVKAQRDAARVDRALGELRRIARGEENLMPPIMEAVRAQATVGEITTVLKEVFSTYRGPTGF